MTQRKISCFLPPYDRHAQTFCHTTSNLQWACHRNPVRKSLPRKLELCLRHRLPSIFLLVLLPSSKPYSLPSKWFTATQVELKAPLFWVIWCWCLFKNLTAGCAEWLLPVFVFSQPTATWGAHQSHLRSQWPRHQYCSPDTGMQPVQKGFLDCAQCFASVCSETGRAVKTHSDKCLYGFVLSGDNYVLGDVCPLPAQSFCGDAQAPHWSDNPGHGHWAGTKSEMLR